MFCSSEKINGNKTIASASKPFASFCSSEKINGNKTESTAYAQKIQVLF